MKSALVSLLIATTSLAGSATWNLSPTSGDWSTATNWTPATVPNGPTDVATFGSSNTTGISLDIPVTLDSMVFNSSPSAFTFTTAATTLKMSGVGIVNNSGATQSFVANGSNNRMVGIFAFLNTATAGDASFKINGATSGGGQGALVFFHDNSTAGNAAIATFGGVTFGASGGAIQFDGHASAGSCTITNNPTLPGGDGAGLTSFSGNATAENATITNKGGGGAGDGNFGSLTSFFGHATAGNAVITNEGGVTDGSGDGSTIFFAGGYGGDATLISNAGGSAGADGAVTEFSIGSNAGNATLIANSSSFAGTRSGGVIAFSYDSDGGTARIILRGNGRLFLSNHDDSLPITVGSIEGDGIVLLGYQNLLVGSNHHNTTFSGLITSQGGDGTITKIGRGSWTLTTSNSYTAGTFIKGGELIVNNRTGSATGNSPVQIHDGALAGNGTIGGVVTVGEATGRFAQISPGARADKDTGMLTLQQSVIFDADGVYTFQVDSDNRQADTLNATDTVINPGAQFIATDLGASALPLGTIFTALNNPGATPISGTFSNLPDAGSIIVGSNTFEASYEGGDGNDLTLTVVP